MDCFVAFAPRNDGAGIRIQLSNSERMYVRIPAARCARALRHPPSEKKRAQGRPGARCTRGLVRKLHKRKRTRAYRFSGNTPAFPAQWFTAYFVLSPVTGLFCHRRPREAFASRELDTSVGVSGPHDFAVRSARARQSQALASTASHRTFVTIASRPSHRVRRRELVALICPTGKAEYFSARGLDRILGDLPVGLFCRIRWVKIALAQKAKQRAVFIGWVRCCRNPPNQRHGLRLRDAV